MNEIFSFPESGNGFIDKEVLKELIEHHEMQLENKKDELEKMNTQIAGGHNMQSLEAEKRSEDLKEIAKALKKEIDDDEMYLKKMRVNLAHFEPDDENGMIAG